ncbi:MoaD family protein, archaeal [Longilinea arvoryzae]|uniref:MoaD family protein, archaeal n=1 Tax=Longilinea arvoryzae TaxID=360412 RepID=A0A0S7BK64_9CHLR|nr:MoaD/ThiS family protein [Longilinea arvoryzae]GAP14347.1 MoaD family protein, archaeal [Longilinea arvoryzae]
MKIRCYAYFRDILGSSSFDYDRTANSLGALLDDFSTRYGQPFRKWVYEPDGKTFSHMVIILINGKDARDLQGLDTPLSPNDTVVLFPPLAGG